MVKSRTDLHSSKASGGSHCSSSMSSLSQAFFGGKIRDKTTKQSRKAAEDLAILKTKEKNPGWNPTNAKVIDASSFFVR